MIVKLIIVTCGSNHRVPVSSYSDNRINYATLAYSNCKKTILINFVIHYSPKHLMLLSIGSNSHSPFPKHVDTFGPVSVWPVGQLKLIVVPSNAGLI